jgi:hypothetical protein
MGISGKGNYEMREMHEKGEEAHTTVLAVLSQNCAVVCA